ncbi:hypothetical protein ACS0TY_013123 [Phlomoides rotata]
MDLVCTNSVYPNWLILTAFHKYGFDLRRLSLGFDGSKVVSELNQFSFCALKQNPRHACTS